MAKSINEVHLVGRLGRDPEVKYGKSGGAWCQLGVATEEWGGKGQDNKTVWHRVKVFGKPAEMCGEYLKKGSLVIVCGRLDYNTWEDKDGVKHTQAEVIAKDIVFPGRSDQSGGGQQRRPPQRQAQDDGGHDDPGTGGLDDVPF